LEALQFTSGLRVAGADLAQEFAIARGVDMRERGASRGQSLRIGDTFGGAKDAKELVALTTNASEEAQLLENHGPGNDGKDSEQEQNAARDQARLSKDISEIGDEDRGEQENDATPQLGTKISYFKNVTHACRVVKTNQMRKRGGVLSFWKRGPARRVENLPEFRRCERPSAERY
jgi:hypothetical protein